MEAKTKRFNVPAPNAGPQPETKLHFLDYWRIIRIRKTVILAVFLLVVLTTTAVTFLLPQTFMSIARIEVSKEGGDISGLLQLQSAPQQYDPYFIQTEFEKIRSQKILNQVINDLGLIDTWGKRFNLDRLRPQEAYALLSKQIDLRQSRNTSLIEIRAYSDNKDEAAAIANKIAQVYKKSRIDMRKELSESGISALKEEFDQQTKKVLDVQKAVDEQRMKLGISELGESVLSATSEQESVRNLERDRDGYLIAYTQANELVQNLQKLSPKELRQAIPTAAADPLMDKLLANLAEAEHRFVTMSTDLSPEHPDVLRVAELIKTVNRQIDERVQGVMTGLSKLVASKKATLDTLTAEVEKAKTLDTTRRALYSPYFAAKRDLETQQRIRDTIYMRILQETVDAKIPKSTLVEIVDDAEAGNRPVRPNIPLNIALGVIVGLIMGFGLAFFIEYLDTSVKTIDDVERAMQAPVLGVIPQNVGSLLQEGPDSPHAEAYRVLRTNLLFSRKDPKDNTITVVSGGAGEGKSTTIFNLAAVFAQNGSRVLLVDSDLRRPSLHKFLNLSNSLGLTNLLLKQNTIEEVIQTTALPTLHFLPSGKLPSSALGILNSTQMREFVQKAKERYDFVFFDSPPIMGVSDASVLASEVDMALLVIQYRKYPQVMTIRAKQMVEKVGGNLLGVVLNNINISQDSYYYYYSGYYYDYYYSRKDDDEKGKGGSSGKNGEAKKVAAAAPAGSGGPDRGTGVEIKQKY
jgi:succinoglycan biosynthesis transport protein ExoP